MSRIGGRRLTIPEAVNIKVEDNILIVRGPKGELILNIPDNIKIKIEEQALTVERQNDLMATKAIHGTINSHIFNMIKGVSEGYEKGLEIVGVGYRFQLKDKKIIINAGYSHPVDINIPVNITVESISNTEIVIKGIDKQAVGEFAAQIRKIRKPEPYKGKGIRYKGEQIRRKEGKKAAK